jgi:DNA uptake protein ComE-like DNA-binding protein
MCHLAEKSININTAGINELVELLRIGEKQKKSSSFAMKGKFRAG